jgi:integrase
MRDPKKPWSRILKAAKIEELTIHDLRRTLATTLSDNHVNEFTIANILGHTNKKVTGIYSRTRLETMYQALIDANNTIIKQAQGLNKWW